MGILLLFFWAMNSAPIDSETPNVLRNGLAAWSAKGDGIVDALHPVQAAERKALRNTIHAEREAARAAHGDQFVLKLRMEQSIVTQAPRFPTQASYKWRWNVCLASTNKLALAFVMLPELKIERSRRLNNLYTKNWKAEIE